jgi:hypothetical protein
MGAIRHSWAKKKERKKMNFEYDLVSYYIYDTTEHRSQAQINATFIQ